MLILVSFSASSEKLQETTLILLHVNPFSLLKSSFDLPSHCDSITGKNGTILLYCV